MKNSFIICNPNECTGCLACKSFCPTSSISLVKDKLGFYKPKINYQTCAYCYGCKNVCPNNECVFNTVKESYALKADKSIRKNSQSGGAFALLAKEAIKKKWVVYGVTFENMEATYKRVTSDNELFALFGSKYVQANTCNIYQSVEKDLESGINVLFSGTPCTIAALLAFLKWKNINTDNLFTIDILCYGAPSQTLLKEYFELESNYYNDTIIDFIFRDKKWRTSDKYSLIRWKKREAQTLTDGYLRFYASRLAYNDSCYQCKYSREQRVADLTIGDCWGIELFKESFDDNMGVSLILINTSKGKALFDEISRKAKTIHAPLQLLKVKQPSLNEPISESSNRLLFINSYNRVGLKGALEKFCDYDSCSKVDVKGNKVLTKDRAFSKSRKKGLLKSLIPPFLKPVIRKIVKPRS